MKFSDLQGDVIDVYQHFNNVYDQQYMEHDDKDGFFSCFKGLVDRSLDAGIYSFVSVKAHNAEYYFSEIPLGKMLDYANSRQIPIWTEIKLLSFLRAKDEASLRDITWKNNTLSFRIQSSLTHTNDITCMIPLVNKGKKISTITSNGTGRHFAVRSIKGHAYAFLTMKPGSDYNIAVNYADGENE